MNLAERTKGKRRRIVIEPIHCSTTHLEQNIQVFPPLQNKNSHIQYLKTQPNKSKTPEFANIKKRKMKKRKYNSNNKFMDQMLGLNQDRDLKLMDLLQCLERKSQLLRKSQQKNIRITSPFQLKKQKNKYYKPATCRYSLNQFQKEQNDRLAVQISKTKPSTQLRRKQLLKSYAKHQSFIQMRHQNVLVYPSMHYRKVSRIRLLSKDKSF